MQSERESGLTTARLIVRVCAVAFLAWFANKDASPHATGMRQACAPGACLSYFCPIGHIRCDGMA